MRALGDVFGGSCSPQHSVEAHLPSPAVAQPLVAGRSRGEDGTQGGGKTPVLPDLSPWPVLVSPAGHGISSFFLR